MAFVIHSTIDLLLNQQRTDGPTLLFTLASLRGWLFGGVLDVGVIGRSARFWHGFRVQLIKSTQTFQLCTELSGVF
jgi:hypothetical protein